MRVALSRDKSKNFLDTRGLPNMNTKLALVLGSVALLQACEQSPPALEADNTVEDNGSAVQSAPRSAAEGSERIVYSSLRPGNWDIYYFSERGRPERLTSHPGLDYDAVFSPDGRWVVFTSERRGNPDLYAIDLQRRGEAPRLLIDSGAMEDQAAFSPDGSTLAFVSTQSGNADIYEIDFEPAQMQTMNAARNLTRHPGGDFRPDYSPDGARIAFSSDRDTPAYGHPIFTFTRQREGELYVMQRDGSGQTRLTDSRAWDGSPEWSPDGETIYFYSARPRELPGPPTSPILGQEGGFRIWAVQADGSNPVAITPAGLEALAPAVMPNGRIAFQTRAGFADWSIVSVDAAGGETQLESDAATSYWLPDFDRESGAMVCHGVGPTLEETQAVEEILGAGALLAADYPSNVSLPDRSLTLFPMRHTTGLAPHPRRNEAAVTVENQQGTRLVLADFGGGNVRDLFSVPDVGIVSGTPNRIFDIKWSDDGGQITYTQGFFAGQASDVSDIWIMQADGGGRRNLTNSAANDGVAAFSPDGRRVVFRSSRGGQFDLFLMDLDGSNLRQLTNDAARDNFPVFAPSGDAIVFSSDKDSALDALGFRTFDNYILELHPDGSPGPVTRISDDPGQDSHPWYSPDGQWIVYTSERGGISDEEPMVQEVVFGPQMYGELYAYRLSDGLTQRLTHNKWEEGNPFWMYPANE